MKPVPSAAAIHFAAFKKAISKSGKGPVQPDTAGKIVRVDKSARREYSDTLRQLKRQQRNPAEYPQANRKRPPNLRKETERGERRLGSGGPGRSNGDPTFTQKIRSEKNAKKEIR